MNIPFDDVDNAIDVNKNTIFDEHQNMIVGPNPSNMGWYKTTTNNGEISQKSLYTM